MLGPIIVIVLNDELLTIYNIKCKLYVIIHEENRNPFYLIFFRHNIPRLSLLNPTYLTIFLHGFYLGLG